MELVNIIAALKLNHILDLRKEIYSVEVGYVE